MLLCLHCTVVQLYTVQLCSCTLYSCAVVHCTIVQLYTVQLCSCTLYNCAVVHCTVVQLYTVQLCSCTLYSSAVVHFTVMKLYTVQLCSCTLYSCTVVDCTFGQFFLFTKYLCFMLVFFGMPINIYFFSELSSKFTKWGGGCLAPAPCSWPPNGALISTYASCSSRLTNVSYSSIQQTEET